MARSTAPPVPSVSTAHVSITATPKSSTCPPSPTCGEFTSSSPVPIQGSITLQPPRSPPLQISSLADNIGNTPSHAFDSQLRLLAKRLSLSDDVLLAAKRIILRIETEPKFNKHNKLIVRAALFAACRQLGIPKTFVEFEFDLPNNRKVAFHKEFKLIQSILKQDIFTSAAKSSTIPNNVDCIPSFSSLSASCSVIDFICSESRTLGLPESVRERAIAISKYEIVENLFVGKRPSLVAAVILSFAAECEELYRDNARYAEAANVSTITFSSAKRKLSQLVTEMSLNELLPPFKQNGMISRNM